MVDKAQKQETARSALQQEREEISAITQQLKALSLAVLKNPVAKALGDKFGDVISDLRDDGRSESNGASMAPRSVDQEEGADRSNTAAVLTNEAFNSGIGKGQSDVPLALGVSPGSATQAFASGGSGSGKGKDEVSSGEGIASTTVPNTPEKARGEGALFSCIDNTFDFGPARYGLFTLRQDSALEFVREEASKYPGLQQLTHRPESMKESREAVDQIITSALAYVSVAVEARNQKSAAQNTGPQAQLVPQTVAQRFVTRERDIDIDPAKLLAYVSEGSDPIVAA